MKKEITYTEINGINYPNLTFPAQPKVNIGKYGHMRLDYLKKHRRGTYTTEYAWFHEAAKQGERGAFPITQVGL